MDLSCRRIDVFMVLAIISMLAFIASCNGGGHEDIIPPTLRAWGTAELIEADDAGDADLPQIAMDGDGNAIAVWTQFDDTRFSIYANYYDGTSWDTEEVEVLETNYTSDADAPQIAVNDSGEAIVVWEQGSSSNKRIYINHFDGSEWDTAKQIVSSNARSPQIAMDDDGNALAVWTQYDSSPYNIRANRLYDTSWGAAELIDFDNNGSAYYPQIAMDPEGNAVAVWEQSDGFHYNIWANYFDAGDDDDEDEGSWSMSELIETSNTGDADSPQIAMDDAGNAIAVWTQFDGNQFSIYANHFDGTSWGAAGLIETGNAGDADSPQIAMNNAGYAIAVWSQFDGTRFSIYANSFDGAFWGTAELIESGNAGDADSPQIAMNNAGYATAVWKQSDGTRFSIYANSFDGTSWGTAELIESGNTNADSPQIVMDDTGCAVAVWTQFDGTQFSIYANRLE